ncbi:MAG TPA: Flp family type IVb pilin [Solirubrobacteraceae bacterium]|jgi:pilus assembly protein Flp/PilA|nr:Flp family type IVb pilin [Solirubrobacteraceae bacterium]
MLNNLFAYLTVALTEVKEREEGQGLVEYALILVLVSIVAIAALGAIGGGVTTVFEDIGTALGV